MKKIVNPGRVMIGKQPARVFVKIEFTNGNLSISGVEGPQSNGDCRGSCGQIDWGYNHRNPAHNDPRYTEPAELTDYADGWTPDMWYTLLEYWHDWHLNDMRSACTHQRALGWDYEQHRGVTKYKPRKTPLIDEFDDGTANDPTPYFDPYTGHACPVCGYSIGSAWLKEEVPQPVIDWLFSLPDTTVKPAWV